MRLIKYIFLFVFGTSFCFADVRKTESDDVVILGSGVGALTSAIYLIRAGYSPVVIEGKNFGGAITQSSLVQNWPGEEGIAGEALIDKIYNHAKNLGVRFYPEEVEKVDFTSSPFAIYTKPVLPGGHYRKILAKNCIIGIGCTPNYLNIPGEQQYWGKGVSICATCDGALYKGKDVVVVGGGDVAVLDALYLSNLAKKVYVCLRGSDFRAKDKKRLFELKNKPNVVIKYNTQVKEIEGNSGGITLIDVEDQRKNRRESIRAQGVFLAIGTTPNTMLFKRQLDLDRNGYIKLKKYQQTSIPGIYAVGDITNIPYNQAIIASGSGAIAALQVQENLESSKLATNANTIEEQFLANGEVIEIQSLEQFQKELKESKVPVLIDFYAKWCAPCKRISPIFDKEASIFAGKVKILKVNVDKYHQISSDFHITSMPTMLVIDRGNKVCARKVGINEILQFFSTLEGIKDSTVGDINRFFQTEAK